MFLYGFQPKLVWPVVNGKTLPSGYANTVVITPSYIDVQFPTKDKRFGALAQGIAWKSHTDLPVPAVHTVKDRRLIHPDFLAEDFWVSSDAPTRAFVQKGRNYHLLNVVKRLTGSSGQVAIKNNQCELSPDLAGRKVFVQTPSIVKDALVTLNTRTVEGVVLCMAGYLEEQAKVVKVGVTVKKRSDLLPPRNTLIYPDRFTIRFPYQEKNLESSNVSDPNELIICAKKMGA